ncbi:hypothetical protein C7T79_11420 [Xanthomonas oryzae pv. oryzicola]|nr:hypothetical protein C7T79_11420 [Xanthomonas oryzae pv. oryzicola]
MIMEKAHWLSRFSATISWSMTSILIQTNMKRLWNWFHIWDSIQGAHHSVTWRICGFSFFA